MKTSHLHFTWPNSIATAAFAVAAILLAAVFAPQHALAASQLTTPKAIGTVAVTKGGKAEIQLATYFKDPSPISDTVDFTFAAGNVTPWTVTIKLFPDVAPKTVENFLRYVDSGRYKNMFFHRNIYGFVVQGGGYTLKNNSVAEIESYGTVPNEFYLPNLAGTLAMAKVDGNPDSATSEWFVNIGDNNDLDQSNGGFTVFGQLANGTSVEFFSYVNSLPSGNIFPESGENHPFTEVPTHEGNLIVATSTKKYSTLSYEITQNTAPGLVSTVLDSENKLTLSASQSAGTATLTVTAYAAGNRSVSQTFNVTVHDNTQLFPPESTPFTTATPGQFAIAEFSGFGAYAYPAGTRFAVSGGEISFDGKKWLKKGTVPIGASSLFVRVKTGKSFLAASTVTLTIGSQTAKFTAHNGAPDLSITRVTPRNTDHLAEGGKFDLEIGVKNSGTAASTATKLGVWFDANSQTAKASKTANIPKLAAGEEKTITIKSLTAKTSASSASVTNDQYSALLRVILDPDNKLPETNETNNSQDTTVVVYRPNLAVTSFTIAGHTAGANNKVPIVAGEKVDLAFTVVNQGGVTAKSSKASLWLSDSATGVATSYKPLKTVTIPSLFSGSKADLVIKNVAIKPGTGKSAYTLTIEVDRENKITGENKNGNMVSIPLDVSAATR
jgi:cyclophilin family peptidyl-prolyl cis-trans isomerase